MKKLVLVFSVFTLSFLSYAQQAETFEPNGSPHFKVFFNYHADFTEGATETSAFELKRSYFGYKYAFSRDISAKLTFDVGTNDAGSAFTAYLKIAQLDWRVSPAVKLTLGLQGNKQFKDQETVWGYRYMFKSFQDEFKFGSSADLGFNAEFTISDNLKANFLIFNGEGYKELQDNDGNQRFGGSIVYEPFEGVIAKVYGDSHATPDADAITNLSLFLGYDTDRWQIGAEYNQLKNGEDFKSANQDHDLDGLSLYATYVFSNKFQIFGRYDQLSSNTLSGATAAWNADRDGNQLVAGAQYSPVRGVKFALNYQGFMFDNDAINNESLIYLNAEFKL